MYVQSWVNWVAEYIFNLVFTSFRRSTPVQALQPPPAHQHPRVPSIPFDTKFSAQAHSASLPKPTPAPTGYAAMDLSAR